MFDNITIELGGEQVELLATPKAALQICKHYKGVVGALSAVQQMNLDDYVIIIRHATNGLQKDSEKLLEDVYLAGVSNLLAPLTDYIVLLANGGKKAGGEESVEGKQSA